MTSEASKSDKRAGRGAVELDESDLDDVAGGTTILSSSGQDDTFQTADGKYASAKLIGRPKPQ